MKGIMVGVVIREEQVVYSESSSEVGSPPGGLVGPDRNICRMEAIPRVPSLFTVLILSRITGCQVVSH